MRTQLYAAFALLLVLLPDAARAQDYPKGQLPTTVTPTHYNVDLITRPDQRTFSGTVSIDVTLEAPTKLIWLHGQDLEGPRSDGDERRWQAHRRHVARDSR